MFIPRKTDRRNRLAQPDKYIVYGWQRSYFTHKLMAGLHAYSAPWEFQPKTLENADEIELRADTHQVPVLHTPENWMIADTTPILHLLDARFPDRRLFPEGELGILVQVIEEFFDEWIARTTVHWRWNYPENHEPLSLDAAHGDKEIAKSLVDWGAKVCRATGVSSKNQQQAAEQEYRRVLNAVEEQLEKTRFLLGDRPTAVDCIVLAGLRAHFLYDPAPKRALYGDYPAVVRWVEHDADLWEGSGDLASFPDSTPFARLVLKEMADTYRPFALGNRDALGRREKAFVIDMYGESVSYLARAYVERSRRMLVDRIDTRLKPQERTAVRDWLTSTGLQDCFLL